MFKRYHSAAAVRIKSGAAPAAWLRDAGARFLDDERGVTAIFFGIFIVLILFVGAVAMDYSRLVTELNRDQRALDAAVLAASTQLGLDEQDETGEAMAKAFYEANRSGSTSSELKDVKLNADDGSISARTSTDWRASLMQAVKSWFPTAAEDRQISVSGKVRRGNGSTEIALVLDNSGSMGGTYISDLKTAAKDLLDTVFVGVEGTDRVMVGVIPFAAAVNVGSMYANASWIDGSGASSIHFENFENNSRTRFQLFSDLGVSWAGCVESRPSGYDVLDTPATGGDTLFVPMFAPDEPGERGRNNLGYDNSYIDDDGGVCEPYERVCTRYSRRGNCQNWDTIRLSNPEAQARTCKYRNRPSISGGGPNSMCTTQPILPLNSTKASIETAIDAMQANGNTNIKEGVAWGWRVLSSAPPFSDGRAKNTEQNSKVLILMTDGENWYNHEDNHNKSIYASHGFAAKGRLGNSYSRSAYTSYLNSRTRTVCENAKADGITIYTIAFRLESDPTTTQLLKDCATNKDQAFTASNGSMLIESFRNIGRKITDLRISE